MISVCSVLLVISLCGADAANEAERFTDQNDEWSSQRNQGLS